MTTPYLTAADVLAAMPLSTRPDPDSTDDIDEDKVARISSLCAVTTEMIDAEIPPINFHRRPADEDDSAVTMILDGRGSSTLHVHAGVIGLESVEVRYSLSGDWDALESDEWELVSTFESEDPARPYDHLQLSRRLPAFPRGVRLTGHFGWETPPARLVEANVAWVRSMLAAGDSYSGAAQVPDGFIPTPRLVLPDPVRMLLTREARRYAECYV